MLKQVRDYFGGLAFGITETVPGVSGGTIAIIIGFYDELIGSVNSFTKNYRKSLRFLIPFLLGAACGLLLFGSIMDFLLVHYSMPVILFFIGLVTGIIPIVFSKVKPKERRFNLREAILILTPALALAVISHLKDMPLYEPSEFVSAMGFGYMVFIFAAGIVAAAALVIPGVSGSFILLLMGIYPLVTHTLASIRYLPTGSATAELWINICKVLVPLAIGIVVGGISMAKLIGKLLRDHYTTAYCLILGLLIGSVYALFREPIVFQSGVSTPAIVAAVVTFFAGCLISFNMGKKRL